MSDDRRPPGPKLWEYELEGGWIVLAGRTEAANDRLSLKVARANDWWFHVRGMPGSHVVLRARDDAEPDRETLRQAAAIAAYHSKARGGGNVAVSCTLPAISASPSCPTPVSTSMRPRVAIASAALRTRFITT